MKKETDKTNFSAIVGVREKDLAIGYDLEMIYSFAKDLENFQKETLGGIVVMGRKTWDSLLDRFKPLKGRTNVVMTRDKDLDIQGVRVVHSIEEVLRIGINTQQKIWIIGGAEIYKLFLPYIDELVLTTVRGDEDREANIFFPNSFMEGGTLKRVGEAKVFRDQKNRMTENLCDFKIETYVRVLP